MAAPKCWHCDYLHFCVSPSLQHAGLSQEPANGFISLPEWIRRTPRLRFHRKPQRAHMRWQWLWHAGSRIVYPMAPAKARLRSCNQGLQTAVSHCPDTGDLDGFWKLAPSRHSGNWIEPGCNQTVRRCWPGNCCRARALYHGQPCSQNCCDTRTEPFTLLPMGC